MHTPSQKFEADTKNVVSYIYNKIKYSYFVNLKAPVAFESLLLPATTTIVLGKYLILLFIFD